jgi:hypothetical protein
MARYLETAAQANEVAKVLLEMVPIDQRPQAAEMVARLVNLGVRCSPRGVQHTVRLNAVRRAVQDMPVKVTMEERTDANTGRKYNALITEPLGGKPSAEGMSED